MFVRSSLCAQSCTFWWMGVKKKNPDQPTLSEKSCGGQPNNFFFGLRNKVNIYQIKLCHQG